MPTTIGSPGISSTSSEEFSGFQTVGAGVKTRSTSTSPEATRGRGRVNTSSLQFPTGEEPDKRTLINFFDYQRSSTGSAEREEQGIIALPVPTGIQDEYNMEINQVDLGMYKVLGDAISRGSDSLNDAASGVSGIYQKALEQDPRTAAAYLLALGPVGTDKQQAAAQAAVGVINNPHTTATFNGVRLKEFNLAWKLSPRSQADANALLNISNFIKQRMHPSQNETASQFALDYPDLCTVQFENTKNMPEIRFSFIENFSLTPGSSGMAFFTDGSPVEMDLSIRFKEIDILTREDLE